MKIQLEYDCKVIETKEEDAFIGKNIKDKEVGMVLHKTYECQVLDRDMVESPKGKNLERFIIDDMQITQKRDIDLVIEMLENVKANLRY